MLLRKNHRHTGMDLRDELIRFACDNRASAHPLPRFGIFPVFPETGKRERASVHFGRFLQIRVGKFEDDFRVAHSKAVHVVDPPAQDKGVVVESEVLRIREEDFPTLRDSEAP